MLSISLIKSVIYYISLAAQDYYFAGGEPPGLWIGSAGSRLGLKGIVDNAEFALLAEGFDRNRRKLTQNAGAEDRQHGWDLGYSAPKWVSVVWAASSEPRRHAIQQAQFDAVKAATASLERYAAYSRRGHGGYIWEKCPLLVAAFEHGTSRAHDPQLHTHAVHLNIAVRPDQSTGTILSHPIYKFKMAAGALYRAELAARLRQLGFRIVADRWSFKIDGVPEELVKTFSKRRKAIEKALAGLGVSSAKASAIATLATRQAKEHIARGELIQSWQTVCASHGLTENAVEELTKNVHTAATPEFGARLVERAVSELSSQQSHFEIAEVLERTACLAVEHGIGVAEIQDLVENYLGRSDRIVKLGTIDRVEKYAVKANFEIEAEMFQDVEALSASNKHAVSWKTFEKIIG